MVYLRDDITNLIQTTLSRFEAQAKRGLYESLGSADSYYDFCFSQYDEALDAIYSVPARPAQMLFGNDRKTDSFALHIPTSHQTVRVTNPRGCFGVNNGMPNLIQSKNQPGYQRTTCCAAVRLKLEKGRFGRGMSGTMIRSGSPIVLSPGMDNFEEIMERGKALVAVHSLLKLYTPLTRFILGRVGTITRLRTVWPQVLPFLPAESKAALPPGGRKMWPVAITRDAEVADWDIDVLKKTLANIAANVAHASMLPKTTSGELAVEYSDTVIDMGFIDLKKDYLPDPFDKPPSYPNYRSDPNRRIPG